MSLSGDGPMKLDDELRLNREITDDLLAQARARRVLHPPFVVAAIPDQVQVGNRLYRVFVGRKDLELARNGDWGECNLALAEIDIRSDLSLQIQVETLLHEVLHGIENVTMDRSRGGLTEAQVVRLASGVLAFLRDAGWIHIDGT